MDGISGDGEFEFFERKSMKRVVLKRKNVPIALEGTGWVKGGVRERQGWIGEPFCLGRAQAGGRKKLSIGLQLSLRPLGLFRFHVLPSLWIWATPFPLFPLLIPGSEP